jgi:hypothetical protein
MECDSNPIVSTDDTIVQSVINKFLQRSEVGKQKYGVTLDRTDLNTLDWITHAQEELMDGILYLERLKKDYQKKQGNQTNQQTTHDG